MSSAAYYRQEAERYRKLVATETRQAAADQLLGYARQYEALAAMMDDAVRMAPPTGEAQRQPMQQQQQKKRDA